MVYLLDLISQNLPGMKWKIIATSTYQWLGAQLLQLLHICEGVTIVLHQAIDILF